MGNRLPLLHDYADVAERGKQPVFEVTMKYLSGTRYAHI